MFLQCCDNKGRYEGLEQGEWSVNPVFAAYPALGS